VAEDHVVLCIHFRNENLTWELLSVQALFIIVGNDNEFKD
jgi:hypothetical protein